MKRLCMERNSTTGGGLMKRNNVNRVLLNDFLGADYADYTDSFVSRKLHLEYSYLHCNPCNPRNPRLKFSYILIFFLLCFFPLHAQDPIPSCPLISKVTANCDTLRSYSQRTDTVAVPQIAFPSGFQQLGENELTDSLGILNPFWEKLRLLHAGFSTDTIRIVHIGDSHIRGRILPRTTGTLLTETFGDISYTDMGINGAFCTTFTRPDRISDIAALHPDLVILSFGTNESHNRRYNTLLHYRQMDELVRMLRDSLPNVPLLMTTPPGSYDSFRKSRRRRTYSINPRTAIAVETMRRFADDNGLAVWDMYEAVGGRQRACLNWQEAKLMRPDHVHYLPEGYVLQGELFYQALLKAYNDYVGY